MLNSVKERLQEIDYLRVSTIFSVNLFHTYQVVDIVNFNEQYSL